MARPTMDIRIGLPLQRNSLLGIFLLVGVASVILFVTSTIDDGVTRTGLWANALAVLVLIYGAKYRLLFGPRLPIDRNLAFAIVLVALVPFILANVNLLRPPFGFSIHHWLGDPVWLYFIPVMSFVLVDRHAQKPARHWTLMRFTIEIVVLFPLWTYLWVILQFVVTDEILTLMSR